MTQKEPYFNTSIVDEILLYFNDKTKINKTEFEKEWKTYEEETDMHIFDLEKHYKTLT